MSDTSRACRGTTYILRCADNKLYVGSTTNIEERLKRHNAGYASEFTHLHRPVELVYKEEYDTYQEAFRRERQLKKWSLAKKEALIVTGNSLNLRKQTDNDTTAEDTAVRG